MIVPVDNSSGYWNAVDRILGWVSDPGEETIVIRCWGADSATFRLRKSDLYLTGFQVGAEWIEFPENYNKMKSPESITANAIHNAVVTSSTFTARSAGDEMEKALKLLIFVVSEGARFAPVRFAVTRAMQRSESFAYADFQDIITNWSGINSKSGRYLVRVDDVMKYMPGEKPAWADSKGKKALMDSHILF